jgi:hypothetical protein
MQRGIHEVLAFGGDLKAVWVRDFGIKACARSNCRMD